MTRQQWLAILAKKLIPLFEAADNPLPLSILKTGSIEGVAASYYDKARLTWHLTISNSITDKIEVAELLISNLARRAAKSLSGGELATLIGYNGSRPDGDKLAFGLRRLVKALPVYPPQMTRKSWLTRLVDELRPLFDDAGHPLPKITASPGTASPRYPGHPKHGMVKFSTSECYVYIWPKLSESLSVSLSLTKELLRCAADIFASDGIIKELALKIGLDGDKPSPSLKFLLTNIIADIGEYPEN